MKVFLFSSSLFPLEEDTPYMELCHSLDLYTTALQVIFLTKTMPLKVIVLNLNLFYYMLLVLFVLFSL